jgi:hypothetical protein
MKTLLALVLALLSACRERPLAPKRPALSPEGERAFDLLLAATRFTDDAVGDGGETPPEVEALRTLWKERDPGAAFAHLAAHASLSGRLFGLCGLWYADPAGFDRAAVPLRELETKIPIQMGCEGGEMPVRAIVDQREKGVRLVSRTQSIKEWFASKPADISARYDIVGGGYPCLFKTGGGWAATPR